MRDTADNESEHIGERLDALLAGLPDDAWTISHDPESDYHVATIVIDWRKVPKPAHTHAFIGEGDGHCTVCGAAPLRLVASRPDGEPRPGDPGGGEGAGGERGVQARGHDKT